jgi:hypothetical protein
MCTLSVEYVRLIRPGQRTHIIAGVIRLIEVSQYGGTPMELYRDIPGGFGLPFDDLGEFCLLVPNRSGSEEFSLINCTSH